MGKILSNRSDRAEKEHLKLKIVWNYLLDKLKRIKVVFVISGVSNELMFRDSLKE